MRLRQRVQKLEGTGGRVKLVFVDGDLSEPESRRFIALQRRFGRGLPVTSACRSPEYNRKVGGAKHSRHMHGDAIDIDVSGLSKRERLKLIQQASNLGFTDHILRTDLAEMVEKLSGVPLEVEGEILDPVEVLREAVCEHALRVAAFIEGWGWTRH